MRSINLFFIVLSSLVFFVFFEFYLVSGYDLLNDSSLSLYIPFDANNEGIALDQSGNGNNGIVNGAIWTANGKFGGSLEFDGINDYLSIKDSVLDLNFPGKNGSYTRDFSIIVWIKPDIAGYKIIAAKGEESVKSFDLALSENGFLIARVYDEKGFEMRIFGGTILKIGDWNQAAFVYDFVDVRNSIMRLYVNGILDAIRTDTIGPVGGSNADFFIGSSGLFGHENFYSGVVDEVMVFRRALWDGEIQVIYDNRTADIKVEPTKNCPIGYYVDENGCSYAGECNPYYVCSNSVPCKDGKREITCEDIACGFPSSNKVIECGTEFCVPEYNCTPWTDCVQDISTRKCVDLHECNNNIDRPIEAVVCESLLNVSLSPNDCIPNIQCDGWEECKYSDETGAVLRGAVRFYGLKKRYCRDLNACVQNYLDITPCESFVSLRFVSEAQLSPGEESCEKDLLTLYLKDKDVPVSSIDLDSWEKGKLDTKFIQSHVNYCSYCFDAVKNFNEEGIDCGGNCKQCVPEKEEPIGLILIILLASIIVLSVIFIGKNRGFFIRNRT